MALDIITISFLLAFWILDRWLPPAAVLTEGTGHNVIAPLVLLYHLLCTPVLITCALCVLTKPRRELAKMFLSLMLTHLTVPQYFLLHIFQDFQTFLTAFCTVFFIFKETLSSKQFKYIIFYFLVCWERFWFRVAIHCSVCQFIFYWFLTVEHVCISNFFLSFRFTGIVRVKEIIVSGESELSHPAELRLYICVSYK